MHKSGHDLRTYIIVGERRVASMWFQHWVRICIFISYSVRICIFSLFYESCFFFLVFRRSGCTCDAVLRSEQQRSFYSRLITFLKFLKACINSSMISLSKFFNELARDHKYVMRQLEEAKQAQRVSFLLGCECRYSKLNKFYVKVSRFSLVCRTKWYRN